jgi:hypothetical protein
VRIYHEFGSGEVIRESSGMEADYDTIKAVSLIFLSPLWLLKEPDIKERRY